jgi:hypothetical protein
VCVCVCVCPSEYVCMCALMYLSHGLLVSLDMCMYFACVRFHACGFCCICV